MARARLSTPAAGGQGNAGRLGVRVRSSMPYSTTLIPNAEVVRTEGRGYGWSETTDGNATLMLTFVNPTRRTGPAHGGAEKPLLPRTRAGMASPCRCDRSPALTKRSSVLRARLRGQDPTLIDLARRIAEADLELRRIREGARAARQKSCPTGPLRTAMFDLVDGAGRGAGPRASVHSGCDGRNCICASC